MLGLLRGPSPASAASTQPDMALSQCSSKLISNLLHYKEAWHIVYHYCIPRYIPSNEGKEMSKIDTKEIMYAGMGSSIQWGAVVGIAIDTFLAKPAADELNLKEELKLQLSKPGLNLPDFDSLDANMIKALNAQLEGSGTNLRAADLKKLF